MNTLRPIEWLLKLLNLPDEMFYDVFNIFNSKVNTPCHGFLLGVQCRLEHSTFDTACNPWEVFRAASLELSDYPRAVKKDRHHFILPWKLQMPQLSTYF